MRSRNLDLRKTFAALVLAFSVDAAFGSPKAAGNPAAEEFFELHVRPLLVNKCIDCHGPDAAESELRLDGRTLMLEGGRIGPAIVPGDPDKSLLIQAVKRTHRSLRMPPESDERLTATEIEHLSRWVQEGAYWPKGSDPEPAREKQQSPVERVQELAKSHWSLQPVKASPPPKIDNAEWNRSAVDRFLYLAMKAKGLQPVGVADRRTLIRRATFDLIGLPPTPEEIDAFLDDDSSDAYAKLIDRLLASPRYGERWGRHWLDVARYADTQGDVGDIPIPGAYRYRDWVIAAFNRDLPIDEFLRQQIAGDIYALEEKNDDAARDLTVATGFLALSRRFGNERYKDHHLALEDSIDVIGRGLMGLTMKCARCHDHKFDPILQTDYYGIYGILSSSRYPSMGSSAETSPTQLAPIRATPEALRILDDHEQVVDRYADQLRNHFRPWLDPVKREYADLHNQIEIGKLCGSDTSALEKNVEKLLKKNKRFRELLVHGLPWLKSELARLATNPPMGELYYALTEGVGKDVRLHKRGNHLELGDVVPRQLPVVLRTDDASPVTSGSGRRELADWLTDPKHPLVARVFVNRVWQHHFGKGIVATSDDFGIRGSRPSHPELLDWLAAEFIREGWSLKNLHRTLMLTRAYQLSSANDTANEVKDPGNTFLWHHSRRRLEAEPIRDSLLAASGKLDLSPAGPFPFQSWHIKQYGLNGPFHETFASDRRSVYQLSQRLFAPPMLGLFNFTDTNQSTSRRDISNLPTQALYLMNSPFVKEQAEAFAKRISNHSKDVNERIDWAYAVALGRPPRAEEVERIRQFLQNYPKPTEPNAKIPSAWTAVARAILLSNEFVFVE